MHVSNGCPRAMLCKYTVTSGSDLRFAQSVDSVVMGVAGAQKASNKNGNGMFWLLYFFHLFLQTYTHSI